MATVLVVDDDAGVRQIASLILKQKGHSTMQATNGLEALMVYSSYRANLDLVLTDIDMPQMNGMELAARIRESDPEKKILMMSGRPPDNIGEYPFLPKPFLPDQLVSAVEGVLNAQTT